MVHFEPILSYINFPVSYITVIYEFSDSSSICIVVYSMYISEYRSSLYKIEIFMHH